MSRIYKHCLWVYLLVLSSSFLQAQKNDAQFLDYLMESRQYDDAIFLSKQLIKQPQIHNFSPAYYAGFAHYNLRELDSAAYYLGQVSEDNQYFFKSRFFQGISLVYLKNHKEASHVFARIEPADSLTNELKTFELAGIALLRKEYKTFSELSKQFTRQYYPFSKQESNFLTYHQDLLKVKKRSPLIAGLMSAVVPGAGKVYAGQLGQGVAIFLQNTIFALQAYEGYRKDGPRSARFLIYGGLFTVFYIGNVWGSVLSVQIKRQEMYDKINNQIVFDMHIPLRTIFN
jgi:hypothetical protein